MLFDVDWVGFADVPDSLRHDNNDSNALLPHGSHRYGVVPRYDSVLGKDRMLYSINVIQFQ